LAEASPFRLEPDGLRIALRVTPNAGADRIEGIETRDDGTAVLRLRVRAVPDKGRANAAVIALIAKALGVAPSAIALVSGETARFKSIRVRGDAEVLAARAATLCHPT
jgi:uncharacterized protein (TIGR00251 family)